MPRQRKQTFAVKVRNFWWLWLILTTIVGGLITFGNKVEAMWNSDEYFEETNDQFQNMYQAQQEYYTQQTIYQGQMNTYWDNQHRVDQRQDEYIRGWYESQSQT